MDLAEAAIEEMSGELYEGRVLLVGMAFIDRGYNDPPDEEGKQHFWQFGILHVSCI